MQIAFIGIRGIPASYSGFETFVEYFARALVKMGHTVTVYNRLPYFTKRRKSYYGVKIVTLPTIANKFLDTFVHTLLSLLHALFFHYDVLYVCGVGNSLLTIIPRFFGKKVILNVDGLDWQREKWPYFAKRFLRFSEYIATIFPTLALTDAAVIRDYYRMTYKTHLAYIPYFVFIRKTFKKEILEKYLLKQNRYILFVGRLVPENKAHMLVEAYSLLNTDYPLVIVGDAPYSQKYIRELTRYRSDKIIFTGYLFKEEYRVLSSQAYVFVLPGTAGGTRVVLLEQMFLGNCLLVNGSPNNREVVGDSALIYYEDDPEQTLTQKLTYLLKNPKVAEDYKLKAKQRVADYYSFKKVMNQYRHLCSELNIK